MKTSTILRNGLILMTFMGISLSQYSVASAPPIGVSFQVFYNELSPYGDWVLDPQFGYVWVPFVDQGFQPYLSNGHWAMTEFGNTWVSNYAWGWAPFHYGRWFWNDFYGWAWVPGYEWGPAWVSWRSGGGYYGWAPLAPGFSISVGFFAPSAHWVFIPQKRFRHRHFHRYCVPNYHLTRVFNRTTVINNTFVFNNQTYYTGPSKRELERVTNSKVPVYQVRDSARPGRTVINRNAIDLYRPDVRAVRNANENAKLQRSYTSEEYQNRRQSNGRTIRAEDSRGNEGMVSPRHIQTGGTQPERGIGSNPRGFENGEKTSIPPREVSSQRSPERTPQPSTRTGNPTSGKEVQSRQEAPQRRIEQVQQTQQKPVQTREPNERNQTKTQSQQPRQQPQQTPRQQPQVEQRRAAPPANTAKPSSPDPNRKVQVAPKQKDNSNNGRTASESRGSRRGVN